jgi:hypothetical protein
VKKQQGRLFPNFLGSIAKKRADQLVNPFIYPGGAEGESRPDARDVALFLAQF